MQQHVAAQKLCNFARSNDIDILIILIACVPILLQRNPSQCLVYD